MGLDKPWLKSPLSVHRILQWLRKRFPPSRSCHHSYLIINWYHLIACRYQIYLYYLYSLGIHFYREIFWTSEVLSTPDNWVMFFFLEQFKKYISSVSCISWQVTKQSCGIFMLYCAWECKTILMNFLTALRKQAIYIQWNQRVKAQGFEFELIWFLKKDAPS